jgi:hypothetical protein
LTKLIAADPSDREAVTALGNILRGRKEFAECADVYSKAVDTISKEEDLPFLLGCFDQLWIGLIGVGGVRCGIDGHPAEGEADNQDADAIRPIAHR